MSKNVLTDHLSEPLNGATTATFNIHAGDGNLTIDRLSGAAQELASGTLQYFEKNGLPLRNLVTNGGQVTFKLRGGPSRQPRFRFPWSACNGATEWQIHLNPAVSSDITAHSDGGNIKVNLAGMRITRVSADTGGGNMDVVLPEDAADLIVDTRSGAGNVSVEIGRGTTGNNLLNANSGAGNVSVCIPSSMAARIHATTGMGKVIMDPRFNKLDKNTYQSPDYDVASNKVEITVKSGAGNVIVDTK